MADYTFSMVTPMLEEMAEAHGTTWPSDDARAVAERMFLEFSRHFRAALRDQGHAYTVCAREHADGVDFTVTWDGEQPSMDDIHPMLLGGKDASPLAADDPEYEEVRRRAAAYRAQHPVPGDDGGDDDEGLFEARIRL